MKQPEILVIDDDRRLRDLLRRFLREQGYAVASAANSAAARALLACFRFDLLVLDVMMPGETGLALTAALRTTQPHVPILLLTARGDGTDRIAGLEAGADDYLTKPFEPRELDLRIRAILRRAPPPRPEEPAMMLGPWRWDRTRQQLVQADGTMLALSGAEAALLQVLAATPGQPVSRDQLAERSQPPAHVRSIDVQVARLRRKIEPDASQPRFILTVRGEGYMLVPDRGTSL